VLADAMSQEDGGIGITPPQEIYSMSPVKNALHKLYSLSINIRHDFTPLDLFWFRF
jgi:hypothetical protein